MPKRHSWLESSTVYVLVTDNKFDLYNITEIADKKHLLIWKNKVKQDELGKQLINLKKEASELEEPTSQLMGGMLGTG